MKRLVQEHYETLSMKSDFEPTITLIMTMKNKHK